MMSADVKKIMSTGDNAEDDSDSDDSSNSSSSDEDDSDSDDDDDDSDVPDLVSGDDGASDSTAATSKKKKKKQKLKDALAQQSLALTQIQNSTLDQDPNIQVDDAKRAKPPTQLVPRADGTMHDVNDIFGPMFKPEVIKSMYWAVKVEKEVYKYSRMESV